MGDRRESGTIAIVPTYVVRAPEGLLPTDARAPLAAAVTRAHAAVTGAPRSFAQVFVEEFAPGRHFIGGEPADPATLFVLGYVRGGRSAQMLQDLAGAVRDAVVSVAEVADDQVWVYVHDMPPDRMIEFGRVLPAAGDEADWIAALPDPVRERLERLDRG